jgi:hypothetical protein
MQKHRALAKPSHEIAHVHTALEETTGCRRPAERTFTPPSAENTLLEVD